MMKINSKMISAYILSIACAHLITQIPNVAAQEEKLVNRKEMMISKQQENSQATQRKQENQEQRQKNKEQREELSCERLSALGTERMETYVKHKANFSEHFGDKIESFDMRRDQQDSRLNELRQKQDESRNAMYARLEEKAVTDTQKEAVKDFKKAADKAVIARRNAVDEAIQSYRKDVDALVSSKKDSIVGSLDSFEKNAKDALEKASQECAQGTDVKEVRKTLRDSLQSAKSGLKQNNQAFLGANTRIESLGTTRKTVIDAAVKEFSSTMEKLRIELKQAFEHENK